MNPIDLLKFMLPGFLVDNFEIVSVDNSEENLHLYFEENAKPPKELDNIELVSKGFTDEITIQDFPLRGKFVFLHIKRRRWTNKSNGEIVKTKPVESPKPSKSTTDALSSLINGPKNPGKPAEGQGNDTQGGDKGNPNGNPYANSYYGSGNGNGGNGNSWGLNGRKISSRGKEIPKCNETGTVVIQITVNQNGNVIAAKPTKGTTNTNPCLVEPAIATAKKHKWLADPNAPATQIGFITINFKLGE